MTAICDNVDACVDAVLSRVGKRVVVGAPIGLAKPVHIINELYRRAVADKSIRLKIVTGLSINRPKPKSDLERRFLDPIVERLFGNSPDAEYVEAYSRNRLPDNIEVVEFYMKAGAFLNNPAAQHHYISTNYSHVGRDMMIQGVNVFAQAVSKREVGHRGTYSLSSNSDSLSLFPEFLRRREAGEPVLIIGQVNRHLPFMGRDAEVSSDIFDLVVDNPELDHDVFAVPRGMVSTADHMIGLYASALIPDGGTLQVGIGSLGDAIASACTLRQKNNQSYLSALRATGADSCFAEEINKIGETKPFERGLYGSTEMFAECFRVLYQNGILKRAVYDHEDLQRLANEYEFESSDTATVFDLLRDDGVIGPVLSAADLTLLKRTGVFDPDVMFVGETLLAPDGERIGVDLAAEGVVAQIKMSCLGERLRGATILHGGFFLGSHLMYDMLRELPTTERDKFCMTGIGYVNQLTGNEPLASLQRQQARFINTAMMMTLTGAACSDGLENGQVVSGVGGQYDFVAMAQDLPDARSVLCLRSTRTKSGKVSSNIVWSYGHTTIPRHLRDIVVTEYGIADLRGQQDSVVIERLLAITDSRFQEELREEAVSAGKLSPGYELPSSARQNLPEHLESRLRPFRDEGLFGPFPLGSDLTQEEQILGRVLKGLKAKMSTVGGLGSLVSGVVQAAAETPPHAAQPYLERLGIHKPSGLGELMLQRIVLAELKRAGIV